MAGWRGGDEYRHAHGATNTVRGQPTAAANPAEAAPPAPRTAVTATGGDTPPTAGSAGGGGRPPPTSPPPPVPVHPRGRRPPPPRSRRHPRGQHRDTGSARGGAAQQRGSRTRRAGHPRTSASGFDGRVRRHGEGRATPGAAPPTPPHAHRPLRGRPANRQASARRWDTGWPPPLAWAAHHTPTSPRPFRPPPRKRLQWPLLRPAPPPKLKVASGTGGTTGRGERCYRNTKQKPRRACGEQNVPTTPIRMEKPTTGSAAHERRSHIATPDMVAAAARQAQTATMPCRRQKDSHKGVAGGSGGRGSK